MNPKPLKPTKKQLEYLFDLMDEWVSLTPNPPSGTVIAKRKIHYQLNVPRHEVSKAIEDTLKKIRELRAAKPATASASTVAAAAELDMHVPTEQQVPAGRYAIDSHGPNKTAFYRVDRPEQGKWAGYVFVKVITGENETRIPFERAVDVLQQIDFAGAESAMKRYGKEIGRCGACHTQLTNDISRALGIGPVCGKRKGWL